MKKSHLGKNSPVFDIKRQSMMFQHYYPKRLEHNLYVSVAVWGERAETNTSWSFTESELGTVMSSFHYFWKEIPKDINEISGIREFSHIFEEGIGDDSRVCHIPL